MPRNTVRHGNIVFRVDDVRYLEGFAYDQTANHDPEGDSKGTWIRVFFHNSIDDKNP